MPAPKPTAERLMLLEHARRTVGQVGFNVASDMLGINVRTLYKWGKRFHWEDVPKHAQALSASKLSKSAIAHDETLGKINKSAHFHYAVAALKAGVSASELSGAQLMERNTAMAFNQNAQAADRTLGWSAERQQPVSVQVAAVIMPTAEERAERRATDAKLDAIAAELRARALPAPPAHS